MLGLFRRTLSPEVVGTRVHTVLGLEQLQRRDQPSVAPTIMNFSENEIGTGAFLISGQVIDPNPGGLIVTFGGVPTAIGLTAVTNADGTFSDMIPLQSGTDLGDLTATTVDEQGLVSGAVALFVNPVPVAAAAGTGPAIINLTQQECGNGLFLITGQVVDPNPGGLVVIFGGSTTAGGMTATATPNGTFSCTVQLAVDGTGAGFLTATTVNAQGQISEEVFVFLDPTPIITPPPGQ